jgi:serine protease Do
VAIAPVTKDVAESIGLGKAQGALVQSVEAGTPAQKAGLEAGDIITKFAGQTIDKAADLPRLVGSTKPGTKTSIEVFRRGAHKDLSITVAELDAPSTDKSAKTEAGKADAKLAASALGLNITDLNAEQKRELKQGGVLVEGAEGPATRAGLRPGDVILAVANVQIASVKEFEAVLGKLDRSRPVSVLVRRGEWAQYAVIRPNAK